MLASTLNAQLGWKRRQDVDVAFFDLGKHALAAY